MSRSPSRHSAHATGLGLGVFALVLGLGTAHADARTQFLIDRLKADDFRVRTNAALQLGATNDTVAVPPLCNALDDSSDVVRSAAAVALKRLDKKEAVPCLKAHKDKERSDQVKLQITRALEGLDTGGGGGGGGGGGDDGPPPFVANAKFYAAVVITNKTNRPDVDRVVSGAVRSKFGGMPNYQLAPKGESSDAAKGVIAKRHFKSGYYLTVTINSFDYSGGNLRVSATVNVATYPDRAIKGEIGPVGVTQTGVRPGDHGAEDNLINMVIQRALDQFAQYFQ